MPVNNQNLQATLKANDTIEVAVFKSFTSSEIKSFNLYENNRYITKLTPLSRSESKSSFIYTLATTHIFKIGEEYSIADESMERCQLDISLLANGPKFEEEYRYDGALGAIYSSDKTIFRLFSPLASVAFVHLIVSDVETDFIPMKRLPTGVHEAEVKGDLDGAKYTYIVKIGGSFAEAPDPYSFSLSSNSASSYIVDLNKVKNHLPDNDELRPRLVKGNEAIIYELSVRDMTSLTDLPNRSTYKALCTPGLKDKNGFPIGLDYITGLGINYVQLLPVYDFQSIDEDHPFEGYNWGYDPKFYFAPEGSYSLDPSDPYQRLFELKELVATMHASKIGVIMDVVYNHVFSHVSNALNVLCPGYYFRTTNDGQISNGSGCGNDLETRNYMCRKLIIDSLKHFVNIYGFDGFRFDLMGIIDIDTLNLAYTELKALKSDILLYGEGWDMMTALPGDKKGSMYNSEKIFPIGFFNDRFRDIAKGKSSDSELASLGYLSGDTNYIDGFKNIFLGSCVALAFPPLFSSPIQSINYVECHDNSTLYDKLSICCPNSSEEELLKRIKLINAMTIFSFGIPFIHAGQEYGATKNKVGNSYKSGDKINGFNYEIAYKRKAMIKYLSDAIKLKRSLPFFGISDKKELLEHVSFTNMEKGGLAIIYRFEKEEYYLFVNPTDSTLSYQFDRYAKIIFNEAGLLDDFRYSQLIMINKCSLVIAKIEKE